MDVTSVAQTGFMAWFSQYGQVVYIFAQMVFWALVGVASIIAAVKYWQYVDFKTGKTPKKHAVAAETPKAEDSAFADALDAGE